MKKKYELKESSTGELSSYQIGKAERDERFVQVLANNTQCRAGEVTSPTSWWSN